ncbi:MAG TPA: hypothetical protein VKY85_04465 [Candidatus Angelobacter sp.]|nr:hypothetical protein [Candidatus Angelobacter sp.]
MTPDLLARTLEQFLAESRHGVVVEAGEIIFDLDSARFSISAERGRCLLHMWSAERNIVREVLDAELKEVKKDVLRVSVRKFAQSRPHQLQICRERDRRTPAARKTARSHYARTLERALQREFPEWTLAKLSTSMNLERSFSPVYARGLLRKGQRTLAVLGVNQQETQASMDAVLTFGLLWLEDCRQKEAGRSTVEGLRLYVPPQRSATLRLRMAYLNKSIGRFQLYELEEADGSVEEKELTILADLESRLQRCTDAAHAHTQFADAIAKVKAAAAGAEIAVISAAEISFRLNGLEFARARFAAQSGSFQTSQEIVFGTGGFEEVLTPSNEASFVGFVQRIVEARRADADKRDPLWRMYPERWLESLIVKTVPAVDSHLDASHVYSQVPAVSASDRSLIDVLTCTREGRLAVLELKADEDIHLPVQGLDYWARVWWHHSRGEFQKNGYFSGVPLSPEPPLLFLVAPALRVHPAVETVLRYFSPEIHWTLVGVDERWREGIKVIFRKAPLA